MQKNIFGYATIVGIKVAIVPLVAALVLSRTVGPTVVTAYCYHVLSLFYIRCKVESASHHTILAESQMMSVDIEIGSLTYTLEFYKHFLVGNILKLERFAIPGDGICQVYDIFSESFVAVECVW